MDISFLSFNVSLTTITKCHCAFLETVLLCFPYAALDLLYAAIRTKSGMELYVMTLNKDKGEVP